MAPGNQLSDVYELIRENEDKARTRHEEVLQRLTKLEAGETHRTPCQALAEHVKTHVTTARLWFWEIVRMAAAVIVGVVVAKVV